MQRNTGDLDTAIAKSLELVANHLVWVKWAKYGLIDNWNSTFFPAAYLATMGRGARKRRYIYRVLEKSAVPSTNAECQ